MFANFPKVLVCLVSASTPIAAMNFEFAPLGKSSKVEIYLSTAFGGGTIKGAFPKVGGEIDFWVENLDSSQGKVLLDARSLHFGHYKVAGDAHSMEWLDSGTFPEISFELNGLKNGRWDGKRLLAIAEGTLKIKNRSYPLAMPLTLRYLRNERRKRDGVRGDLLILTGETSISRSKLGINPNSMLDAVTDALTVKVSLLGGSNRVRPFLPSALFGPR